MRSQGSLKVTPRFTRQATPRSLRSGPGQFLSLRRPLAVRASGPPRLTNAAAHPPSSATDRPRAGCKVAPRRPQGAGGTIPRAMNPPLDYIDCSLPHEAMTLGEYRRTRTRRRSAACLASLTRAALRPRRLARMSEPTKFVLGEDAIPTHWVNLLPDLPGRAAAAAEPADRPARRPRRPHADLPDGADHAGGLAGAGDRDPGRGPRRLPAVAPDAAVPRAPPRAGARHAGEDLLQVRGRLARGLAQAELGRAAGLRERAGRDQASSSPRPAPASGAPRWRSPARCSGWSARSTWSARSYDQKPYRRSMMQTWGATVHRSPSDRTQSGRAQAVAPDGLAGDRDLRGGRDRGARTRTPTTRSAPCSTTCCCTRP